MVSTTLRRIVSPCWKPSVEGENSSSGGVGNGRVDGLLWYEDSGEHVAGEFSMAVIQANNLLEDHSQLESGPISSFKSGPHGTLVGIYDGHGGPETARFINKHLFGHIKISRSIGDAYLKKPEFNREPLLPKFRVPNSFEKPILQAEPAISVQKLRPEDQFLIFASDGLWEHLSNQEAVNIVNTCPRNLRHMFTDLTAFNGAEFTTENHGMSADVINKAFLATEEDFLNLVKEQFETKPQIASVGSCCLVGIICSGLLYIANAGDSRVVLGRLEKAFKEVKAVQLSSEHNASFESVREELRSLHPDDPQIVVLRHNVWRVKGIIQGIARRLIKAALREAAKKREMRYSDLKKIDRGVRRHFHDDITVIVLFLDFHLISNSSTCRPLVSIRGGAGVSGNSKY
ncbi:hypothetical protein GOBAR_AA13795 [Gossypium barbadense]|uniref:protein-serine/threonine phosphatase n=1 Tax=Gossypium barbadense TaxID=3634 RepID=A0A2P5XU23_GOSBA|nr:hypothetical protein GOBAR_AA13795 [Gossypium barbadense]